MNVSPIYKSLTTLKASAPLPITQRPEAHRSEAKLKLLRAHDTIRIWHALSDNRVCLLCGSEFSGQEIQIKVRAGKPVFQCPSPPCRGTLRHFALAGNPLLSEETWSDWMRAG